jgi:non-ribosomal peptide synthetase component E (peptide arylation enzyme)
MVEIVPVHALPSVLAASDAQTLLEVLEWHEARLPQRLHLTVLQETILGSLTYAELATKARVLARRLAARDVAPGDNW